MYRVSTIGALAVCAFIATPALAEPGRILEGNGYRLSEGVVLHSSAGAEGGVISNVFYEDDDPVASGILRIAGDVRVSSRDGARLSEGSRQRLSFDAGLGLGYQEYLSGNATVRAQRDLDIDAFGNLVAFPDGDLSFELDNRLRRVSRPTNFESTLKLNRLVNELSLGPDWRPGGGTMTFGLRYRNRLDFFERSDAPYPDRVHHSGHIEAAWDFLPATTFSFDGSIGYYDTIGDSVLTKNRATNYQGMLGLSTAITERTGAEGYAGYRYTDYDAGENFSGVVGGLSLSHYYSPVGMASVGYERVVQDSINANFFKDHRIHAGATQQIERFVLGASGDIRFRDYVGVPDAAAGESDRREDFIVGSNLDLRYQMQNSMQASLRYRVARVQTDFVPGAAEDGDPSYVRHMVLAGFRAAF